MQRMPMTVHGKKMLESELATLKHKRIEVSDHIATAREMGDLKENAEYHAAREQQSFIEGRIQDIESKLSSAQVIDVTKISKDDRVIFGATVKIFNISSEEQQEFCIVGEEEANLKEQKISVVSPVARSIIGKREGDEVIVSAPHGEDVYRIERVEYI